MKKKTHALYILLVVFSVTSGVWASDFNYSVPTAGSTPGPTWASNIATALETLRTHTHTGSTSEGPQLGTSSIVENATHQMNDNAITEVDYIDFNDTTSSSSGSQGLYLSNGGNLFFDGVQITDQANGALIIFGQYPSDKHMSMSSCAFTGTPNFTATGVEYDDTATQTWVAICPVPKPESGSGSTITGVTFYANTTDVNCDIDSGIHYYDVISNSTVPTAAETKTNEDFGTAYGSISFTTDVTPGLGSVTYIRLDPGNDGASCDNFFFFGYYITYSTTLYGNTGDWTD